MDARGQRCPLPTVMAALALERLRRGAFLELLADDPATARDFPGWCREFGHVLLNARRSRGGCRFLVRKG